MRLYCISTRDLKYRPDLRGHNTTSLGCPHFRWNWRRAIAPSLASSAADRRSCLPISILRWCFPARRWGVSNRRPDWWSLKIIRFNVRPAWCEIQKHTRACPRALDQNKKKGEETTWQGQICVRGESNMAMGTAKFAIGFPLGILPP